MASSRVLPSTTSKTHRMRSSLRIGVIASGGGGRKLEDLQKLSLVFGLFAWLPCCRRQPPTSHPMKQLAAKIMRWSSGHWRSVSYPNPRSELREQLRRVRIPHPFSVRAIALGRQALCVPLQDQRCSIAGDRILKLDSVRFSKLLQRPKRPGVRNRATDH